jgi:hypothetical protein
LRYRNLKETETWRRKFPPVSTGRSFRMEALVNAVSEFLAAIFARFGYVGRARRRAHVREDLALLDEIRKSDAYGAQSQTASYLHDHINREVAAYSGIELKHKRKIPWGTVILSIPIGLIFAYWTYKIVDDGFSLLSLLPGTVAAFFLIGGFGVLFTGDDSEQQKDQDEASKEAESSDD